MVVIDTDILESEIDEIKDSQVLATYLGGKIVFQAD
jgi:predicted amidohydrolase YtcJ